MAAHILRCLVQEARQGGNICERAYLLKNALGYAKPFDRLDYQDWGKLNTWCESVTDWWYNTERLVDRDEELRFARKKEQELESLIFAMLPTYVEMWEDYNRPRRDEEWGERWLELAGYKREASNDAEARGHQLGRWRRVRLDIGGPPRTAFDAVCLSCGADVRVMLYPAPNETHIAGPAIATDCKES